MVGFYATEDQILAITYSRTFMNIFLVFVIYNFVALINSEVSKVMEQNQREKASRILLIGFTLIMVYIIFIYLPLAYNSDKIFTKISNLNPEVTSLNRKIILLLIPYGIISGVSNAYMSYVQSVSREKNLVSFNLYSGISSFIVFLIFYFIFEDKMISFYAYYQSFTLTQLFVLIYIRKNIVPEFAKIKELYFEMNQFCYFLKQTLWYLALHYFDFMEQEIILILATYWVTQKQNAAFGLSMSYRAIIDIILTSQSREAFNCFTRYLGRRDSIKAKSSTLWLACSLLISGILLIVPFYLIIVPISHYSFGGDASIVYILTPLIYFNMLASIHTAANRLLMNVLKALELRLIGISMLAFIHYVIGIGTAWFSTVRFGWQSKGLAFSRIVQKICIFWFIIAILYKLDWKARLEKLKNI